MKNLLTDAACVAASLCFLAGCAGVRTDVRASSTQSDLAFEHSYAIARSPVQEASDEQIRYEALVRAELVRYGLVDSETGSARYVLSIAYDTRPAGVVVDAKDCKDMSCNNPGAPGFFMFSRTYRHSLTLRFFDPANGDEVYKVNAASRDGDADSQHAIPYLVKSALTELPFAPDQTWRVKLHPATAAGDMPQLLSVHSLHP
jgi:hypothetical protein